MLADRRSAPQVFVTEVTVLWGQGRLLLFCELDDYIDHTNDDQSISKKLLICNHCITSLLLRRETQEVPSGEGLNRLPFFPGKHLIFILSNLTICVNYLMCQNREADR